ncbi:deoxyribodipyrimidine photo-lyase [Maribacter litopenaei]|uniref:deoxyribodipyrimidine photo-lyase n=1 Tax=Maribacter litopenaei TaxID=2976127 RepID=UPI0030844924
MNNLVWFRNDLRVQDNISLAKASLGEKVIGVYCFDPLYFKPGDFGFKKTERYRAKFLIESVMELRDNLRKHNIPLFVYVGKSSVCIAELIKEQKINDVYLQKEWTRDETSILDSVKKNVSENVNFHESYDQFLFHPEDIPYRSYDDIPKVFTDFRKKCEKFCNVRTEEKFEKIFPETNFLENQTIIPTLTNLGLVEPMEDSRSAFPFNGGETMALQRIKHYFGKLKNSRIIKKQEMA